MIQYTGEEAELESSGVPEERANMSLCLFPPVSWSLLFRVTFRGFFFATSRF